MWFYAVGFAVVLTGLHLSVRFRRPGLERVMVAVMTVLLVLAVIEMLSDAGPDHQPCEVVGC